MMESALSRLKSILISRCGAVFGDLHGTRSHAARLAGLHVHKNNRDAQNDTAKGRQAFQWSGQVIDIPRSFSHMVQEFWGGGRRNLLVCYCSFGQYPSRLHRQRRSLTLESGKVAAANSTERGGSGGVTFYHGWGSLDSYFSCDLDDCEHFTYSDPGSSGPVSLVV
ncbi:hypothetical protein LZ30DRAFT_229996 [Colletotrichum cereale]|nr:hypothetical protein LZ30DRAFT_229996 [Colletotrichum cereale]